MIRCPNCNEEEWNDIMEYEIICENCGSSYGLEYLGYYREDSSERIDEPNPEVKRGV